LRREHNILSRFPVVCEEDTVLRKLQREYKTNSSIITLLQLPADRLHQISIQDRLIIFFQFDCVKIVPDVVPVLANVIVNQSFVFGIVLAIKVKR